MAPFHMARGMTSPREVEPPNGGTAILSRDADAETRRSPVASLALDLEPVVWAFRGALGDRSLGLAADGSVVTDDAIPDFSDLDVWVLLSTALTLDDGLTFQRKMPALDGVSYVQPTYRTTPSNRTPSPTRSGSSRD